MCSDGLITPHGSIMRYSLYGALSEYKQEKEIKEQSDAITKKLFPDTEVEQSEATKSKTWKKPVKGGSRRKNARSTERVLEADVEAMLSTFKL